MLPLSDDVNDRTLTGDLAEHRMRTGFNLRVGDRTTSTFLITKIGYMYIQVNTKWARIPNHVYDKKNM